MGKNSARSKGYRKTYQKVTGYTKKEKKIMTIGFLVIIVVLIGVLVLPEWIESFSLLKVDENGVVITNGDNWIVGNTGTYSAPKYRKLGETNPIEGFELSEVIDGYADDNVRIFVYLPTGEAAAQKYTVQAGTGEASELVERYRTLVNSYAEVSYMDEEVHVETINGMKTYSFVLEYAMEDFVLTDEDMGAEEGSLSDFLLNDPDPTAAPETGSAEDASDASSETTTEDDSIVYSYTQCVPVYVDCNVNDMCIFVMVTNEGADTSVYGDRDALHELALKTVEGLSLD